MARPVSRNSDFGGRASNRAERGILMRPVKRGSVSKGRSAAQFRGNSRRTKAANVRPAPMRGGFRL